MEDFSLSAANSTTFPASRVGLGTLLHPMTDTSSVHSEANARHLTNNLVALVNHTQTRPDQEAWEEQDIGLGLRRTKRSLFSCRTALARSPIAATPSYGETPTLCKLLNMRTISPTEVCGRSQDDVVLP